MRPSAHLQARSTSRPAPPEKLRTVLGALHGARASRYETDEMTCIVG